MRDVLLQKALDLDLISSRQALEIQSENQIRGTPISSILLREGHFSEKEILTHLSRTHRLEYATFNDIVNIEAETIDRFSTALLREWKMLPLAFENRKLPVAVEAEPPTILMDKLSVALGCFIYPKITTRLHLEYGFFCHLNGALDVETQGFVESLFGASIPRQKVIVQNEVQSSIYESEFQETLQTLKQDWANVLLFQQKGNVLHCRLSKDEGQQIAQRNLNGYPLGDDIVLSKVLLDGYPYVGDVGISAALNECLKSRPLCGYLLPLVVSTQIVGALYVDNGLRNVTPAHLSKLHFQKEDLILRLEQCYQAHQNQKVQKEVVYSTSNDS